MNQERFKKIGTTLNNSIGFILFLVCAVAIYNKVASNDNLNQFGDQIKQKFYTIGFFQWAVLIILFVLNYLMESIKWKLVLAELSPITILKSYKSVLVGQAFAFFTPARSGDYVGRILFLEAGNKLKGLAQMAWASYAQLLITLFFGSIGLSYNLPFLPWLKWAGPFIAAAAFVIYFHPGNFTGWLKKLSLLQIKTKLKGQLVLFAFLKYCVFILQYTWVVKIFNIPIGMIDLWVALSVLFFCLSLIPSIALTDVVIRGQLIVLLLSPFYDNSLMLICVSTIIWAVNFLLPAIIGSILLINFRIKQ
ncbi:MAG: hypothetical protein EXR19_05720 [Chitinophagaceae bacterium]|nr:hypothetical protein [Chitinophagaceae bacterium]